MMMKTLRYRYCKARIAAYVDGELSRRARARVARYIDADPACYALYANQRDHVRNLQAEIAPPDPSPLQLDRIWTAIQREMNGEIVAPSRTTYTGDLTPSQARFGLLGIAITLSMLLPFTLSQQIGAFNIPAQPAPRLLLATSGFGVTEVAQGVQATSRLTATENAVNRQGQSRSQVQAVSTPKAQAAAVPDATPTASGS